MWPKIVLASAIALAVGIWLGASVIPGDVDSGDLVTLVSVIGTILIAVYTVRSNRTAEESRQAHERAMQTQQFREGRAILHREETVDRLIELRRTLAPAAPFMFDFRQLVYGSEADQGQVNVTKLQDGLGAAAKGVFDVGWFSLSGWTDEIQRRADEASAVLGELIDAWGQLYSAYLHPSASAGIKDPGSFSAAIETAWEESNEAVDRLQDTIRKELARGGREGPELDLTGSSRTPYE